MDTVRLLPVGINVLYTRHIYIEHNLLSYHMRLLLIFITTPKEGVHDVFLIYILISEMSRYPQKVHVVRMHFYRSRNDCVFYLCNNYTIVLCVVACCTYVSTSAYYRYTRR